MNKRWKLAKEDVRRYDEANFSGNLNRVGWHTLLHIPFNSGFLKSRWLGVRTLTMETSTLNSENNGF